MLTRNDIPHLRLHGCRETVFFHQVDGRLCQRLELELAWTAWRGVLEIEVSTPDGAASRTLYVGNTGPDGRATVRCWAPAVWPGGPVEARLLVRWRGSSAEGRVTIGSHRPWTVYLLSDLCADDTWAYADLEAHDADDCATTLVELRAGPGNRYNFATAYQVQRFLRRRPEEETHELLDALRTGRLWMTPVPNQLLPGAFNLAAYPLLLGPYRRVTDRMGDPPLSLGRDAYHMEGPTWTPGLGNLLRCAGFRTFGKSMLSYAHHAPWVDVLRGLPRLTRWQVAPGRFMYLLLRCGDYAEGAPLGFGLPRANAFLHEDVVPAHESLREQYPVSAIPLVGMYSDLSPESPQMAAAKLQAVDEYNSQGWDYPRLVNATWAEFFDHVRSELGEPDDPRRPGLRTVSGATGSCWEAWMLRAQAEAARFRRAQQDLVSLRTLCAMLGRPDEATRARLDAAAFELVHLGDHAWNGSSPAGAALNLSIRRGRLDRLESALAGVRQGPSVAEGARLAVVNVLDHARPCAVSVPDAEGLALADPASGEQWPVAGGRAVVPEVPAFGARRVVVRRSAEGPPAAATSPALEVGAMAPRLLVEGREQPVTGGWASPAEGRWQAGPFAVSARLLPAPGDATELALLVEGVPPAGSYALRWSLRLPWQRARWRAETGGGFMTYAPAEAGGDLLMGIAGSCVAVGHGLCAFAPDGTERLEFAFGESGLCGLGGPMTELAAGDPNGLLSESYTPAGVMVDETTLGILDWYLLTTDPLPNEQIPDQGGARRWAFRCAFRGAAGAPDDAALYRFAAGFATPGLIAEEAEADGLDAGWLDLGTPDVLVLGMEDDGTRLSADLHNTSAEPAALAPTGTAVEGARAVLADMLSRPLAGPLTVPARSFARLLIER